MKDDGWKLRRAFVLGLSVLIVSGVAIFVSTSDLFAQWTPEEEEEHRLQGYHGIQIDSAEFAILSEESISAVSGAKFIDRDGLSTLPVSVRGMAGRGYAEGIGETMYWLDKSRPVPSMVREKRPGTGFPAVHEMRFHLLLTTEVRPGRTFRSINPAVMVNNNALTFPPKLGTRYVLKNPVEFEDIEEPGVVALRIVSNKNRIVGSRRHDAQLGLRPFEN